jgi:hypothetical protein
MMQKISLLLVLLFSLSIKVDSLIIKSHQLTFKQTIQHLADLDEDEVMSLELCQFGCYHHRVYKMSITKESEHYNLVLYQTPQSELGGIYTSEYHDSTAYHNSFTFSTMQLADFQEALFPNKSSHSTNHNIIKIRFQDQEYWSIDRASKSNLKTFLESLEADQCTCENSKYFRTQAYKDDLIEENFRSKLDDVPISPFIEDLYN